MDLKIFRKIKRKTLQNFSNIGNHLFNAVIYGLMFYKQQLADVKPKKEDAQQVLGDSLYFDLLEIEPETQLDNALFGFFDRCYLINKVLAKHGFFIRFFDKRNICRFLIETNVQGKNEVTGNLSSCVIEKLNGYETIRNEIERKEKLDFNPINIVYQPTFDEREPVVCNLTDQIHLAYRSYIGKSEKNKEKVIN